MPGILFLSLIFLFGNFFLLFKLHLIRFFLFSNPASTIPAEEASAPARSQALSSGNAAARYSRVSFPLSAADLPPSPTKSRNLSETAEVPACNVPSRSPLPALAIPPETKLGTPSSGLGTLNPSLPTLLPPSPIPTQYSPPPNPPP